MATDRPTLSAQELREQMNAETRLAKLDLFEDLAELHDTEVVLQERVRLSAQYQACVGVPPQQRNEFRAAMERILAGNGGSVDQVLASTKNS